MKWKTSWAYLGLSPDRELDCKDNLIHPWYISILKSYLKLTWFLVKIRSNKVLIQEIMKQSLYHFGSKMIPGSERFSVQHFWNIWVRRLSGSKTLIKTKFVKKELSEKVLIHKKYLSNKNFVKNIFVKTCLDPTNFRSKQIESKIWVQSHMGLKKFWAQKKIGSKNTTCLILSIWYSLSDIWPHPHIK